MNVVPDNVHQSRYYVDAAAEQRWTMQAVLDVAVRRIRFPLIAVAVCLALAGYYLATTPDSFTATAVLMLDTKQTPPSPSQISQDPMIDPAVVDSQIEILKSQRIAQQVVDRLNLAAVPEFGGGPPGLRARLIAKLSGHVLAEPTAEMRRRSAADALLHKVKITRAGHSYLAEIAATALDPKVAADVANGVADAYIKDQLDSRLSANQRTVTWMAQRVAEVKAQADAAAEASTRYRQDHAAEVAAGDAAVLAESRALSATADAARSDYESLQNRSLRLAQFIQQQTLPVTEARILTVAEPPSSKSAPKTGVILLLAIVGGLIAGAGLAVLRETLDRRLRSAQQVKAKLGLPVAGTVPAVKSGGRAAPMLATLFDARQPWCTATETLRALKVTVDSDLRRNTGVVIGLVSAWPGEGKSTLALNMARMLTEIGASVLVVDADLKKPDLSLALGAVPVRGLADLIDGAASTEDCVVRLEEGFDLIGHGSAESPLHPFDLLGSRRMQAALTSAQGAYDYVLVDLPALLTSVDSQSIARFVDHFVLVTESGRTAIDDVERALGTSEVIATRIAGVILNKARGPDRTAHRRVMRRHRGRRIVVSA